MRAVRALALPAAAGGTALALATGARLADASPLGPLCGPAGSAWTLDAWVTVPLAVSLALYATGALRLRARAGRGREHLGRRVAAFGLGWLALAGALVSPLHRWGEGLFTAHMIEHEIVMAVAAPLLVLARPWPVLLWALPRAGRRPTARAVRARLPRAAWAVLTQPAVASLLHAVAIWAWHAPALFDAAVLNLALHRAQHLAFLVTALLFWWSLVRRDRPGAATGTLALTMLHTSLLGALLALSPRLLYPGQTAGAGAWGLSPLEDQQLAGLVMWIPAGTIYAAAALAFAAHWIRRSGATWKGSDAVTQV
ncbi:cytochrome c oxidase assembly protein [Methylobacterium sp. ID0610]|uniref:cytochrome c oxidase assembly protein n=1 Tax=Methylobacterium carpenticola TaxID=3344827 RepID=UPI00367C33F9